MAESIIYNLPEEVRPEHIEKYIVPVNDDGSLHLDGIHFRANSGSEGVLEIGGTPELNYYINTNGVGISTGQTGTSNTVTIPITTPTTEGNFLFIVMAAYCATADVDGYFFDSVTDTKGGSWHVPGNNGHIIGAVNEEVAGSGFAYSMEAMGWTSRDINDGVDNLDIGDSITININPSIATASEPKEYLFMCLEYDNLSWIGPVSQNGSGTQFSNGDSYPDGSTDPTTLSWPADITAPQNPYPDSDAYLITLAASVPTQTQYTPATGTVKNIVSSDNITLAITENQLVAANETIDPGGVWTTSGTMLVGNYQFIQFA